MQRLIPNSEGLAPTRRPRVLFVGAFGGAAGSPPGGQRTACQSLLHSSFAEDCDLDLLDSTQRSFPPPSLLRRGASATTRWARFDRALRRRPEVVLLFASGAAGLLEKLAMARAAERAGARSLLFLRSGWLVETCRRSRFHLEPFRRLLRIPSALLCQSEVWKRALIELFELPPHTVHVVENWVDPAALEVRPAFTPTSQLPLVFVGRLIPAKGIFELAEATARCQGRVRVEVLGQGSPAIESRLLESPAARRGWLHLRGWVTGPAKWSRFEVAHGLVLPTHSEGSPNVVLEAMGARLPVLTTTVGPIPNMVSDGIHGRLVAPRDVFALTDAMLEFASNPQALPRWGRAGHARVLERHTLSEQASALTRLIRAHPPPHS